jgi:DNA-binding beta-propeller fold protein YncE
VARLRLTLVFFLAAFALQAPTASAAPPELLGQVPEDGVPGSAAGRLDEPASMAVDPNSGHVLVADSRNQRVSEFTAWGEFVKAFGWGVADGSEEFQTCSTSCRAGIAGTGAGQFNFPHGIVADSVGDLYVTDRENLRVEKFTPNGEFLLMFGYEVNKTTGANVCTATDLQAGEECGAGAEGSAPTQFSNWFFYSEGAAIAISTAGNVYVGDLDRIQVFAPDGSFIEAINFSEVAGVSGGKTKSLAFAPNGDLYIAFFQDYTRNFSEDPYIYKIDPQSRQLVGKIEVDFPRVLNTDSDGNLFVIAEGREPEREEVLVFDADESCVVCLHDGFSNVDSFFDSQLTGIATSNACGVPDIYIAQGRPRFSGFGVEVSFFDIYGPHPETILCPAPMHPPSIQAEYARSVGRESAQLGAEINPRYWADTAYYLEYGEADCATSSCQKAPLSPRPLSERVVNAPLKAPPVQLEGLSPATTYHYRFVAESSGGGPTVGPGRTFTTRGLPEPPPNPDPCPNAALRRGASAALPDCRAYELVSPLEKGGVSIINLLNVASDPAWLNQSTPGGGELTYTAASAFGDPQSAPYASQYIATRSAEGWRSESISPPRGAPLYRNSVTTDTEFKAFSPDLCLAWLRHDSDPPLAPGAPEHFADLYRRDRCADDPYRALRTPDPNQDRETYKPELQGFSAEGSHSIFQTSAVLDPAAQNTAGGKLYESVGEEEVRFVCILPSGQPVKIGCSAGSENSGYTESNNVAHAISADGSKIFWSTRGGRIYVRVDGGETLPVSAGGEAKSGTFGAFYWTATPSGSEVLFEAGSDLYTQNLEEEKTTLIAHRSNGVMGASEDLSRIYLVSEEALAPGAAAGEHNLYLYEGAGAPSFTFIGRLGAEDAMKSTLGWVHSPVNSVPIGRTARVSPDGKTLAFMASGSPTGYENLDRESGKPDAEVYIYRAGDRLRCVSCDPTGARPSGREQIIEAKESGFPASAELAVWESSFYASRALSDDGSRLYFESYQQLVPTDSDESQDVYEWEAPGTGGCLAGRGDYSDSAGGCVSLISSGEGEADFLDASADGRDVFIGTLASLVPQDYGLRDIYDVRVEGGFPPPAAPAIECEGVACQSPPPTPRLPTPSSTSFTGPAGRPKPRCPKGRRLVGRGGKAHCVRKHRRVRRTSHKRGARSGEAPAREQTRGRTTPGRGRQSDPN